MAPPPATTAQLGVIATTLPPASLPTATNCWVPLIARVSGLGVTVMLASGPGATAITVTVAWPAMLPLRPSTVLVNVPGTVPAVRRPPLVMAPPPATMDQTGAPATMLPPASLPTATNCCVPLMGSVSGLGLTVMVARGPTITVTVAVPDIPPLTASTVAVNTPGTVPAVN